MFIAVTDLPMFTVVGICAEGRVVFTSVGEEGEKGRK